MCYNLRKLNLHSKMMRSIFTRYFLNTYDSIEEVRSMGQLAQRSTDGPGIGANKPSTVISPLSWKAGRDLQSKAEGTCH